MSDEKEQAITLGPVAVVRAFRPGDVVFIETSQRYTVEMLEHLSKSFELVHKQYGIKMVLLDCGMKLAGAEVTNTVQP